MGESLFKIATFIIVMGLFMTVLAGVLWVINSIIRFFKKEEKAIEYQPPVVPPNFKLSNFKINKP